MESSEFLFLFCSCLACFVDNVIIKNLDNRILTFKAIPFFHYFEHIVVELTFTIFVFIGCGSGLSGETLSENGHQWIGLDISESMLSMWTAKFGSVWYHFVKVCFILSSRFDLECFSFLHSRCCIRARRWWWSIAWRHGSGSHLNIRFWFLNLLLLY